MITTCVGSGLLVVLRCGIIGITLLCCPFPQFMMDAYVAGYRCTVHRVIPGRYKGNRRGIRTTVFGEKREYPKYIVYQRYTDELTVPGWPAYFDPASESRDERNLREEKNANGDA